MKKKRDIFNDQMALAMKTARLESCVTHDQVIKDLDINAKFVESGNVSVVMSTYKVLADYYGVPLGKIITNVEKAIAGDLPF